MSHNESERRTCLVEWCKEFHSKSDYLEDDLWHSKAFGTYDDGTPGVVSVGISQFQGKFSDIEVYVQEIIFSSADDLRTLARDCLEAAEWMDENFTAPTPLRLIG